jgi:hypothetical protein
MRFLISVIDNQTGTATSDEMAAIDAFNDGLRERGQFIFAGGLAAPDSTKVIDNRNNRGEVSAGPLHHGNEYLSGFWIIEAIDEEAALILANSASLACNRRVELRPLL